MQDIPPKGVGYDLGAMTLTSPGRNMYRLIFPLQTLIVCLLHLTCEQDLPYQPALNQWSFPVK